MATTVADFISVCSDNFWNLICWRHCIVTQLLEKKRVMCSTYFVYCTDGRRRSHFVVKVEVSAINP